MEKLTEDEKIIKKEKTLLLRVSPDDGLVQNEIYVVFKNGMTMIDKVDEDFPVGWWGDQAIFEYTSLFSKNKIFIPKDSCYRLELGKMKKK